MPSASASISTTLRSPRPVPRRRRMSKTGAIERPPEDRTSRTTLIPPPRASASAASASTRAPDSKLDTFFLPDFCATRMVFAVVLIAELVAVTLALARPDAPFLTELARISLFLQWLGLTNAALLCYSRRWLAALTVPQSSIAMFALILLNTVVISELALMLGTAFGAVGITDVPTQHWPFLLRNAGIALIVTALLLRYFFVTHQWQKHVRAEALSRIQALQARIRPHFLFNSMNTIAALTRSDPKRAEEAVEDLADLFRATLRDSHSPLRLKEELELSRIYQRIEALRLGARLARSEEHTSELQSQSKLVCRLLLEKKKSRKIILIKQELLLLVYELNRSGLLAENEKIRPILAQLEKLLLCDLSPSTNDSVKN